MVFSVLASAQTPVDINLGKPVFEKSVGFFPSENRPNTDIEVYLSIPFGGLQFVRTTDFYTASFTVLVVLFKGKELITKVERVDTVSVSTFAETGSPVATRPRPFILADVPGGEYSLQISTRDRESGAEYSEKTKITVPAFPDDNKPYFSSVVLLYGEPLSPCIKSYYPASESLFYKLEVLSPESLCGDAIRGIKNENEVFIADTVVIQASGGIIDLSGSFVFPENARELVLFAKVRCNGKIVAETEKKLIISAGDYFLTAATPKEAIDQLGLIGTDREIRELEDAFETEPEKLGSLIDSFWKSRDPTPSTETNEVKEEFYRRLAIANERFEGITEGWRTDRGKIYIIYGEPDEIDRHPFDLGYRAYEVWYYFNPRRTFYFEDRIGDGTYELIRQE